MSRKNDNKKHNSQRAKSAPKPRFRTRPVGLVNLQTLMWTPFGEIFAMSVSALIPTLIFFIILRERLIKGMAMIVRKS